MIKICRDCGTKLAVSDTDMVENQMEARFHKDGRPLVGIGTCQFCKRTNVEIAYCRKKGSQEDLPKEEYCNVLKHRLCPGMWVDMNDALHFSLPEICAELGWEPTKENQDAAQKILMEVAKEVTT